MKTFYFRRPGFSGMIPLENLSWTTYSWWSHKQASSSIRPFASLEHFSRCQFHQHFTSGLFSIRSQRRKITWWLDSPFALLGSACVKAAHKTFVKLTLVERTSPGIPCFSGNPGSDNSANTLHIGCFQQVFISWLQ
jgi:hypothetical protein